MTRSFDPVLLGSIELFCLAAEQEGFTAAARQAGVTPAAVSRSIARLEARLGVRLFVRSTRSIRLTDAGRAYFAQCRAGLAQLMDAERAVSGNQRSPVGKVRLSLPTTYGQHRVLPLLARFRERYPGIRLDVQLSNRNVDFVDDGYDLAVRARAPRDSRLVVRKLEDAPLAVVAAPAYLARVGTPQTLADLAGHECIQFLLPRTGRPVAWTFRRNGRDVELPTTGGLCCIDDLLGGIALARAGAGLYQTYRFLVEEDLARSALVEVLADWGGASRPFSLVYPHARHQPQSVRALVDFLLEALAGTRA